MQEFTLFQILVLLCALGSGLVAGVFYAFSTFVMKALGRLPAAQGIAAMQSINVVVINPLFMAPLFGTALLCLAVMILAFQGSAPGGLLVAGGLLYVLGTIGVTIAFNVPRNNSLAGLAPATAEAAALWTDYLSTWTRWNHMRTLAALAAAAAFTIELAIR